MTDRPFRIFIASASEGLDVANAIRDVLQSNMNFDVKVWRDGTFKPSMTFIEALEAELNRSDFAVLTLTPDDQIKSRGKISMTTRDNVLFELGLFMGHLGRERTYFVFDRNHDLKIPTDLLGVNPASYERRKGQNLEEAITTACSPIAQRIRELGVRLKRTPEAEIENRLVSSFCEGIAGTWWGHQRSDEQRLSLFRITLDHGRNTVQLEGDTFNQMGQLFGQWNSVAIGIRVKEATLSFYWEGAHPTIAPGETFKGFGYYVFKGASGIYERGNGLFADIHMGRKKPALWKSVELRRVDASDVERIALIMKNGTDVDRASEVIRAFAQFTGSSGKAPNLGEGDS